MMHALSATSLAVASHPAAATNRSFSSTSTPVAAAAAAAAAQDTTDAMEFPGGRVPFTSQPEFLGGVFDTSGAKIPCYRTLDGTGKHIEEAVIPHELEQEEAIKLYTAMAKLQVMDTICYDAQRQVSCWPC